MKRLGYIFAISLLMAFAACSGGGSASDYFTPGITTVPPTLEAAEGEVREAFTAIASYSYGQVIVPVNATFTLKNSGDYSAKLTRTSFGSDQFSFLGGSYPGTGGTCTTTIKSKASCTIVVRFAPQINQSITALMSLYYDSMDGETSLDILLSGSGGSTPTISSLAPATGLVAGGTTLIITGSGFLSGAGVTIGSATCTSVSVASAIRITCLTPAHTAGGVDVVVANPDGQRATFANGFIYVTAPALAVISDQSVNENVAIAQINANDGGDDFDGDGDVITYTCYYDTTVDGAVSNTTLCSALSGVSFTNPSGELDWTPSYSQSGSYEFKITGNDSTLSDDEIFTVTVSNVNRSPSLANISNQSVNENVAITQVDAADSGDDLDSDSDAIIYTCYYDTTVDGAVAAASTCASLTGISFTSATGVMDWTPSYSQNGSYEFKMTGSDGSLSDAKIFTVTVANVNRAPSLANISNQSVNENAAITQVNANDGGDDFDVDSEAITYTCYYDSTVDAAVADSTLCTALTGVSFTGASGVMDWTPSYTQSGSYEFKVTGSDGSLTDNKIFTVTVANVNRAPSLAEISDQSVNTGVAISQVNANDGGDDLDVDGDTITYTCYYDTTSDGSVTNSTLCSTLAALSFNTSTGVLDWTPATAGTYEMKITGSDGSLSDDEFLVITVAAAGGWIETKLTASDGTSNDYYGYSVAVSDTSAIVGAFSHGSAGAAYLYLFDPSSSTWMETKLTASDPTAGDSFGRSVGISGTIAIVGDQADVFATGAAYIYRLDPSSNTWAETKLTASDGGYTEFFGISTAISGTTAIVGAQGDLGNAGSAYIYRLDPSSNTWAETKLTASDGVAWDLYGTSVAISGTTAIVGAYAKSSNRGAAYIYRLDPSSNTWAETKLTASDTDTGHYFGGCVAISGTIAIIGAYGDAGTLGAAYLYRLDPSSNTWAETKLTASDRAAGDWFGFSSAISGTTAIVGAYGVGSDVGAAYIYRLDPSSNTWAETKLTASDGAASDEFGFIAAISGTTVIIGANGDASHTGAAYIYKLTLPASETKLTASDGGALDYYGSSVAISETSVIVGAVGDASLTGSAYIYQYDPSSNTWAETKITASDAASNDSFGVVGISGNIAIVGAWGDGGGIGSAYLYRYDPSSNIWGETKLTASDGAVGDQFGYHVAISETTAIVSAPGDASSTGSVYLYRLDPSSNTWAETKLIASDGTANDAFGNSVAISGVTAIVGAYNADSQFGAAYIYRFDPSSNTWAETKLSASDGAATDWFGMSVSISGTIAIVGAHGDAAQNGSAYLFQYDPSTNLWGETKLIASDAGVNDYYGYNVSISGTTAIVGAPGDDSSESGAAYLYRLDPSSNTWAETKYTATDGAAGDSYGTDVAISGTTVIVGAYGDATGTGAAYLYGF